MTCPPRTYKSYKRMCGSNNNVGLYPSWALEGCEGLPLVREDRGGPTSGVPVVDEALPGSYVGKGELLKASKRETLL